MPARLTPTRSLEMLFTRDGNFRSTTEVRRWMLFFDDFEDLDGFDEPYEEQESAALDE